MGLESRPGLAGSCALFHHEVTVKVSASARGFHLGALLGEEQLQVLSAVGRVKFLQAPHLQAVPCWLVPGSCLLSVVTSASPTWQLASLEPASREGDRVVCWEDGSLSVL